MKGMPIKLKLYTMSIIGMGAVILFLGFKSVPWKLVPGIMLFTLLGTIAESLGIRVKDSAAISVNFVIGLAAILLFEPNIAALIGYFSMVLCIENIDGKWVHIFNSSLYKRVFNGSDYAISLTVAGYIYGFVHDHTKFMNFFDFSIPGILLSIFIYSVINTLILSILMTLLENRPLRAVFNEYKWMVINIIGLAPLGVIIAVAYDKLGWFAVILFFGPLLVARYSFKLYMDMRHVYFETIKALSNAMEAKDEYTNGHSYRVAEYAVKIAEEMGLEQDGIGKIKTAAILHDIGKIGIADGILNKDGKLEDDEYAIIKTHPEIGAQILDGVDFLKDVRTIIKYHHERFDGKGYPEGISGDKIPIEAAILSVADTFDAMTSNRPYRKAMDRAVALRIISEEAGYQLHPAVVKAFCSYMKGEENRVHVY